MELATKTTVELRGLAREEAAKRGMPSAWTATARRADLESFLSGGGVPPSDVSHPRAIPSAAPAADATPTAAAAEALLRMLTGGGSAAVDALRAEVNEELLALRGAIAAIPGGVAEAVAEVATLRERLDALGDLREIADLLRSSDAKSARLPLAAAAVSDSSGPLAALMQYYTPGKSNGGTVACLCAPPSFGKSWAIRRLGESYDCFVEHGCTADLDEAARLLGTVAPDGKGGFITVDGSLTEAVRRAGDGENVLLCIDEIFRLRDVCTEALLTFLVPRDGRYVLRTRHPKDGAWETISCPVERLHIVAASNLGPVPPLEALWSRLEIVRFAWSQESAARHAATLLRAYDISGNVSDAATAIAKAIGESRTHFAAGQLVAPLDFRSLERACRHAGTSTVADVLKRLAATLPDQLVAWHPDTGDERPESRAAAMAVARILSL